MDILLRPSINPLTTPTCSPYHRKKVALRLPCHYICHIVDHGGEPPEQPSRLLGGPTTGKAELEGG